ncbi:MAG: immune inhibitor A [bacterium]|nr:immune inhibitor A [bacterium]
MQVSANGGPWTTVAQYDGTLSTWTQVTIDLAAYAGQDLALRFYLTTDVSLTYDGWYIDDVELEGATPAFADAAPVALSPVGGAVVGVQPALTVANSTVPGGGAADYGFRVYRDAACTDVAATVNNVAETAGQTAWTTPTLAAGNYWWRAWAGNGVLRTSLTEPESFTVSSYVAGVDLGGALNLRVLGGAGGLAPAADPAGPGRCDRGHPRRPRRPRAAPVLRQPRRRRARPGLGRPRRAGPFGRQRRLLRARTGGQRAADRPRGDRALRRLCLCRGIAPACTPVRAGAAFLSRGGT